MLIKGGFNNCRLTYIVLTMRRFLIRRNRKRYALIFGLFGGIATVFWICVLDSDSDKARRGRYRSAARVDVHRTATTMSPEQYMAEYETRCLKLGYRIRKTESGYSRGADTKRFCPCIPDNLGT